jgi:phytoene dehydrogenase-like protein
MARIVIVGAGMAGLAAAARLATLGHRVTLCEAAPVHGGMVGRSERDGFAFDTGPTLLTLPAVYRDLFLKTGRDRLEDNVELRPVDPAARHLLPDGTVFELANASRAGLVQALDAALGAGTGERWSALLERGRQVWEATRRPLLEEPLPGDTRALHEDPYPAVRRRLRAPARTVAEIGSRELRHPGLAALLEEHALRFGLDPRRAPGSLTVLPYMEQTFGVWYITGGMRALADAVLERCRLRGVELRFGARVEELLGSEAVTGVLLADGSKLDADVVLSSSPALSGLPVSAAPGRCTVLLALRGPRPADAPHRTVLHAADRGEELDALFGPAPGLCARPTLELLRPNDPSLAPPGHHTAVLTVTVPPQGALDWTDGERAESYADALLAWAERAAPGLREAVLWRQVRTPADTERETGAPGGSVAPPALAGVGGAFLAPANGVVSPIGLYRIGGSAHPGGGLPRVGMSAALAAELIGTPS